MSPLRSAIFRRRAALSARLHAATPRERMMLAALCTVGVLILLSGGVRLLRAGLADYRDATAKLEKARLFVEGAPDIDAALAAKFARLAGKRLSASDLLAAVDTISRESGLNADASTPRTERSGGLTVLRLKVNLRAPTARKLMDFDDRLRLKGDGLLIERVNIDARSDSGELAATYEIATCQPSE